MDATGPSPVNRVTGGPVSGSALAEDSLDLQHPVLRRLQRGDSVAEGVRRGAAWVAASKLGAQLLQFLGIIITARLLTPEDYGKAAVVLPLAAFAALFSSLGLGSAVIHSRRLTERSLSPPRSG